MSTIDEVRERLDIVEVISGYVVLKKAGRAYKGLCPFHPEKTPSFTVDPARGSWHCFGACATGGDVFAFVMRAENTDFRGALELLARRAGVELEAPSPAAAAAERWKERLYEALAAAASFYHRQLMRGTDAGPARDYLTGRGFGGEMARQFELGWAPAGWDALGLALQAEGFRSDELLAAGLARERDGGGQYDAFRARLTIPIRDARGRAIGFGARTLDPDGVPKYLNSPQTEVFDKSQVLFGLDKAGPSIREAGEAVVVEGYTDVIRAHGAGLANVVASLGTALTAQQIQALKRRAKRIVLALDADAAGQAATVRGLAVAQEALVGDSVQVVPTAQGLVRYVHQLDVDLRVAALPAGQDPDDVIRADPEQWRALVRSAQPVMTFLIEAAAREHDLASPTGKSAAIEALLPFLQEIPDPVLRSAWVAEVAKRVKVDERSIENRLTAPRPARCPTRSAPRLPGESSEGSNGSELAASRPADGSTRPRVGAGRVDLDSHVLGHLLRAPRRLKEVNARLRADGQSPLVPDDFEGTLDRDLLEAIRHAGLGVPPPDAPDEHRLDALPPAHEERRSQHLDATALDPPVTENELIRTLRNRVLDLRQRKVNEQLVSLTHALSDATGEEKQVLLGRVYELSARRGEIERLARTRQKW